MNLSESSRIPKLLPLFSRNQIKIYKMIDYFQSKYSRLDNQYLSLIYEVSKITKMKYHGYCLLDENKVIEEHITSIDDKNITVLPRKERHAGIE